MPWIKSGMVRPSKDDLLHGLHAGEKILGRPGLARPTHEDRIPHQDASIQQIEAGYSWRVSRGVNRAHLYLTDSDYHPIVQRDIVFQVELSRVGWVQVNRRASSFLDGLQSVHMIEMAMSDQDFIHLGSSSQVQDQIGIRARVYNGAVPGLLANDQVSVHRPGADFFVEQFDWHFLSPKQKRIFALLSEIAEESWI
jgi:hypothetical protein